MPTLKSFLVGSAVLLGLGCSNGNAPLTTSGSNTGAATTSASTSSSTGGTSTVGGSTGGASAAGSSSAGGTSGSTTGTSGGSTSGGTTGIPDSGCSVAGSAELSSCSHGSDCQCPAACVADSALEPYITPPTSLCEVPCVTTADCAAAYEVCRNGSCSPNTCATALPDGGSIVGSGAWQICDAIDGGDGTCAFIPGVLGNLNTLLSSFYCVQGGDSLDVCDLNATRAEPALLCRPGLSCRQLSDGGAGCVLSCDRAVVPDTCPIGRACSGAYATSHFGTCYVVGVGGCATGLPFTVGAPCARALDCGCPQQCVVDPGVGDGGICEDPCQATSDCTLDIAHCVSGLCQTNFCVSDELGNAAPGAFDSPCTVDDGGPGTCLPAAGLSVDAEHPEFGFCLRPGTSEGSCQPPITPTPIEVPSNPGRVISVDQLCPSGEVCNGDACVTICDPFSDAGSANCVVGQVCLEHDGDPVTHFGYCGSCLPAGSFCSVPFPEECCGTCVGGTCQ